MNVSQKTKTKSGRTLGYAEYGVPSGRPVFYFHGYPGSRLEAALIDEESKHLEVRLIGIDRPGMGLSDYQENRTLLDFPDDVVELAEYLELDEFTVLGVSGGGPYALACAHKIPSESLSGCAVVAGSGPYHMTKDGLSQGDKNMLFIAKHVPWLLRLLLWYQFGRNVADPGWWEKNYSQLAAGLPEPDEKVFLDPRVKNRIIDKTREAFLQGSKGLVHDFKLYSESWGFDPSEIPVETRVLIFHGELDKNVPISYSRTISEQIPNCKSKFYHDEGHLSLLVNRFEEIVNSLLEA